MVKLLLLVSPSTSTECSLSRLFLSISLSLLKLGFHLSLPLLFMDLKVTAIDVLICSRYVFSSILFWGGGTVYFCCRSVFFLCLLWLAELCWYQYCDSLFSWEVESVWESSRPFGLSVALLRRRGVSLCTLTTCPMEWVSLGLEKISPTLGRSWRLLSLSREAKVLVIWSSRGLDMIGDPIMI